MHSIWDMEPKTTFMSKKMWDDAVARGKKAFEDGLRMEDCPHHGTMKTAWRKGYAEARAFATVEKKTDV